jgi:hypothetical protein
VLARYEIEGRVEFGRRAGAQDKDLLAKSVCCGLNLMNLVGGTRKAGINQNANGLRIWDQIVQHRESLGFKRRAEDVHARGVCAGPIETFDNPQLVRIGPDYENDRDC